MELSLKHRRCLELANNSNCFFTGEAGTGKSFLLQEIKLQAVTKHGLSKVFVTAPTGHAAKNVGGSTLHHFAGIVCFADTAMFLTCIALLYCLGETPSREIRVPALFTVCKHGWRRSICSF